MVAIVANPATFQVQSPEKLVNTVENANTRAQELRERVDASQQANNNAVKQAQNQALTLDAIRPLIQEASLVQINRDERLTKAAEREVTDIKKADKQTFVLSELEEQVESKAFEDTILLTTQESAALETEIENEHLTAQNNVQATQVIAQQEEAVVDVQEFLKDQTFIANITNIVLADKAFSAAIDLTSQAAVESTQKLEQAVEDSTQQTGFLLDQLIDEKATQATLATTRVTEQKLTDNDEEQEQLRARANVGLVSSFLNISV